MFDNRWVDCCEMTTDDVLHQALSSINAKLKSRKLSERCKTTQPQHGAKSKQKNSYTDEWQTSNSSSFFDFEAIFNPKSVLKRL